MLMEFFNHPIVQGVISNAIYGLILLCGSAVIGTISYFGWWRLIGQWLVSESKESNWGLIFAAVVLVFGTWVTSQKIKVVPLEAQVAKLEEEGAELRKIVSDWRDAYKSYRDQNAPLLENYKKFESYLAECQSNLKQWSAESQNSHKQWKDALEVCRKENSGLQKTVNSYVSNCSIISEIRALDKRKATIDSNVQNGYSNQQPESNDLQVRILVYQQKLRCEPN
jgi:hypothetical protein